MRILNVVGARPNFMKIAPLHKAMQESEGIEPILIHTGQHYDANMSKVFFDELNLPKPDEYLNVGSGSHAQQTAKIMIEFERCLEKYNPDIVFVVGDVNSTMACSLVAKKMHIRVIHYEAGLRSFDRRMPEEINRLVTDSIADFFYVSEKSGLDNLLTEGHSSDKMLHVGNLMIDTLVSNLKIARNRETFKKFNSQLGGHIVVTLHRPENVDNEKNILAITEILNDISKDLKIIFPIHPRTRKNLENLNILNKITSNENIFLLDPIGYLDFLSLISSSKFILTDSGGIQEETTFLKIPCITLRKSTERPSTTLIGSNTLVSELDPQKILKIITDIKNGSYKTGNIPHYWDGKASLRIVEHLQSYFQ